MEFWLLILIAVLEIVDGQGLALRIIRVLQTLIGGPSNVETSTEIKNVKSKINGNGEK